MNILFLSGGRRIELLQHFIKKKKELGFDGNILAADMNPLAPALFFAEKHFYLPHVKSENYISSLFKLCLEEKVALLIPTIDTELQILSEFKDVFAKINTRLLVSDTRVIDICRNKYNTYRFFKDIGIITPDTYNKVEGIPDSYPLFIKPIDGSSSINTFKINNKAEMEFFYRYIPEPIIQEYIFGEEYTIDVMCDFEGTPVFITPRKRIAVRSGEVLKSQISADGVMCTEVLKIVKELKPVGPITVQAIKNSTNGINYYIEINARFGGGAPISMAAGADSAGAIYNLLEGKDLHTDINAAKPNLFFLRFDQSIVLEQKGDGQYVKI